MAEAGAEVAEEVQGGWDRTVKDLTSGAAGGIAQVLIGELRSFYLLIHMLYVGSLQAFPSKPVYLSRFDTVKSTCNQFLCSLLPLYHALLNQFHD